MPTLRYLKSWRLEEARKHQAPAFTILHDRVLAAIATARPRTEADLLAVTGIGPTLVRKYGQQILAVLKPGRLIPFGNKRPARGSHEAFLKRNAPNF